MGFQFPFVDASNQALQDNNQIVSTHSSSATDTDARKLQHENLAYNWVGESLRKQKAKMKIGGHCFRLVWGSRLDQREEGGGVGLGK